MKTNKRFQITFLIISSIAFLAIFSCSLESQKMKGKWHMITLDNKEIKIMDNPATYEFVDNGKCFFSIGDLPLVETYDWKLSGNKIVLTQNLATEVLELLENRILVLSPEHFGTPGFFIKSTDKFTTDEFISIIKRNKEKSNYLKAFK